MGKSRRWVSELLTARNTFRIPKIREDPFFKTFKDGILQTVLRNLEEPFLGMEVIANVLEQSGFYGGGEGQRTVKHPTEQLQSRIFIVSEVHNGFQFCAVVTVERNTSLICSRFC